MDRHLAAILAADVVGYSRLMGRDEAGTLARLMAHRKEFLDPTIRNHRGRIVKLMGDGMLVEFASVVDALECAVEMQRGMLERNQADYADQRIEFRIGINLGDVIVEGKDIYGDGVNVAARLEALAKPGGICISGMVHASVGNKLPLRYVDMGEQQVKNIDQPVRAFHVEMQSTAQPTGTSGRGASLLVCDDDMAEPQTVSLASGEAVVFTRSYPGHDEKNEDALGVFEGSDGRVCLVVADGVGGLANGHEASAFVVAKIKEWMSKENPPTLEEFIKKANDALMEKIPRAGTTISVVEVNGAALLSSHAGDSTTMVVGQKGRVKLKVDNHSPVGMSESLGLIDEDQALHHPKRHYLNNMLGDPALWVETHEMTLAARDTVLLASDGLWDNLYISEVVDIIRAGKLSDAALMLANATTSRMDTPGTPSPSKPDDLTFILYRPDPTRVAEDADE